MRLNFKKKQDYMHQNMETPDWVTEIKTKRAKEAEDLDEEAKANAWKRMGGAAAPGEPRGLATAKQNVPGSAPEVEREEPWLGAAAAQAPPVKNARFLEVDYLRRSRRFLPKK